MQAHKRIENLLEQLNQTNLELSDAKISLGKGNEDSTKELERTLRALAAEKSANDLLQLQASDNRAQIDALTNEMKANRSSSSSSNSELDKLRLQIKAYQTDNDHLHDSLNEYTEVCMCAYIYIYMCVYMFPSISLTYSIVIISTYIYL